MVVAFTNFQARIGAQGKTDKQGRVVPSLTKEDFTLLDGGQPRPIVEFQPDSNGPISVALLMDGGTATVYAPRAWEAFREFAAERRVAVEASS